MDRGPGHRVHRTSADSGQARRPGDRAGSRLHRGQEGLRTEETHDHGGGARYWKVDARPLHDRVPSTRATGRRSRVSKSGGRERAKGPHGSGRPWIEADSRASSPCPPTEREDKQDPSLHRPSRRGSTTTSHHFLGRNPDVHFRIVHPSLRVLLPEDQAYCWGRVQHPQASNQAREER